MLKNTAEQLELYKSEETSSGFFDTVVFCTNVTYADGNFKGGACSSFLFLKKKEIKTNLTFYPSVTSPDRPFWRRPHLTPNPNGERGPVKNAKRIRGHLEIPDTRIPHGQRPRLALYRTRDQGGERD